MSDTEIVSALAVRDIEVATLRAELQRVEGELATAREARELLTAGLSECLRNGDYFTLELAVRAFVGYPPKREATPDERRLLAIEVAAREQLTALNRKAFDAERERDGERERAERLVNFVGELIAADMPLGIKRLSRGVVPPFNEQRYRCVCRSEGTDEHPIIDHSEGCLRLRALALLDDVALRGNERSEPQVHGQLRGYHDERSEGGD